MKRLLAIAVQVGVLVGTAYLLVATSAPPCRSKPQSASFQLSGTCGPPATLAVAADSNCQVTVEGASYLPNSGWYLVDRRLDGGSDFSEGFGFSQSQDIADAGAAEPDGGHPLRFRSCESHRNPDGGTELVLECITDSNCTPQADGTGCGPSVQVACYGSPDGGSDCRATETCTGTLTPSP